MPSKGIVSYGYVASSNEPNAQIEVLVPSANYSDLGFSCSQGTKQDFPSWGVSPFEVQYGGAQINLSDICDDEPDTAGTVTIQTVNVPEGFSCATQIFPITGEIGASTAENFLATPAVIAAQ